MLIRTEEDIDHYLGLIGAAAAKVRTWFAEHTGDPLDMLRQMKFEPVGFNPIEGHALNLVEQINQTWTYAVALAAARQLLTLHPDAGGYRLAPGARASEPLDIVSVVEGLVGAETFAVVDPANNRKLELDVAKMADCSEVYRHRYVFFLSPKFPGNKRLPQFERDGVQVCSVDV
jgi:hypothetical protein